jgi:hypothetical protein
LIAFCIIPDYETDPKFRSDLLGANPKLISTLTGSSAGDQVGNGTITVLPGGDNLLVSPNWANGGTAKAGAVTWCTGR